MNKKAIYASVFGFMAIIVAGMLLSSTYASVKNPDYIDYGNEVVKIKKIWQNTYLLTDRIAENKLKNLTECKWGENNTQALNSILEGMHDKIKNTTQVDCKTRTENFLITSVSRICGLSFDVHIECTEQIKRNSETVFEISYEKKSEINVSKSQSKR